MINKLSRATNLRGWLIPSLYLINTAIVINHGSLAFAGTLPPVVQVNQSSAISSILNGLSSRSAASNGTWIISRSGLLLGAGAGNFSCGISGPQWYLQRDGVGEGWVRFYDGEDYFEPLGSQPLVHGLDTLEMRFTEDSASFLILMANLRPTQFLSSHQLVIQNHTKINDIDCVVLRANIGKEITDTKRFATWIPDADRVENIDYYIDPVKNTINRVVVQWNRGRQAISTVDEWDQFGTASYFPKKISGNRLNALGHQVGGAVVTEISAHSSTGAENGIAQWASVVHSVPVYGGDVYYARQPALYETVATADPNNLTKRVLLAQAYFRAQMPKQGLEQWALLEQSASPETRSAVQSFMIQAAPYGLSKKPLRDSDQEAARLATWVKLVLISSTDQEFAQMSESLTSVWQQLRTAGDLPKNMQPFEGPFLEKTTAKGTIEAMRSLIKGANKAEVASLVDPMLRSTLSSPIPASGYTGSRPAALITAALQEYQFDRTKDYVNALQWSAGTTEVDKLSVQTIFALLQVAGKPLESVSFTDLVTQWKATMTPAQVGDDQTRTIVRSILGNVGSEKVRKLLIDGQSQQVAGSMSATVAQGDEAADYWAWVTRQVTKVPIYDPKSDTVVDGVQAIAKAYQITFNKPDFEALTLLLLSDSKLLHAGSKIYPARQLQYIQKACEMAQLEETKFIALDRIVLIHDSVDEHDQALTAIERLKGGISSSPGQTAIADMISRINDAKASKVAKKEVDQKAQQVSRLKGRLAYLEARLEEAKRHARSAADIASINELVIQTRSQIEATAIQTN